MKSKFILEKMELDGEIVAVPVGENACYVHEFVEKLKAEGIVE